MKYCIVEIITQTATFRNPEFQNFHKTIPIAPPTTLVGLAGAAMGLNPAASQIFFEEGDFVIGAYCKSQGLTSDLWKYDTFGERSIILKEILYQNRLILAYGSDDVLKVEQLIGSFFNPVYCLTLGNSDSLAKVVAVKEETETTEKEFIENCIIEGDVIETVLSNASNKLDFSIYTTSDPIAIDLPTRFTYDGEYGMRRVNNRKKFSLITSPMQLNLKIKGIQYKESFIPLFKY